MKIFNPKNIHRHTIIILHGMYNNNTSLYLLANSIQKINNNIKIILPNSPVRNIDWPAGKENNVNSWYNYYTRNDGLLQHDTINIDHYNEQCERISKIITSESKIVGYNNILVIGESQGGTIVAGLAIKIKPLLAGFVLIDSVFMDNILTVNTRHKNIYIYSSENDEVYTIELQKQSIKNLYLNRYIVDWYIDKGVKHCEITPNRNKFILSVIDSIFK